MSIFHGKQIKKTALFFVREWKAFLAFLKIYITDKLIFFSTLFESRKNAVVKGVLIKRGKKNRFFLHVSIMVILTIGVLISPFISETQLFGKQQDQQTFAQGTQDTLELSQDNVFKTQSTVKIRDEVITYTVQKGDTVSSIAQKFGISEDTIKWANNLTSDSITIGDSLSILPVTGVAHKVAAGDTVYTIAKKYDINAQGIVDFPFNDFANPQTFSLVTGQIVIVPDGVKPEEQTRPQYTRPTYYATTGSAPVAGSGFAWPVSGSINQGYAWYHTALDLGAPVGTPVLAAQSGSVAAVYTSGWNFGYGTHVIIAGDNGYSTLYAHMNGVNVSGGDRVVAGSTVVGWVGLTGRTTGAHLHFEVRSGGGNVNPLSFLR